ncbi:calponin homology domain-containing protein [Holdemania massiliensis]|uniref:hypothetical protein n=1 Tax=Holdemania massiliensis TaxID=1468449 RepID=UPI0002E3797C|nr:hypothetical protein [Holdemania massiliensis]
MKKYSIKQQITTIINAAIFLGFLGLTFSMFMNSEKTILDWAMLIFCLAIFACAVYYEYLKYLYQDALYTLNFLLDPEAAEMKYQRVCRMDITKNYEKNSGIFEVMLAMEKKEPDKVLKLIAKNEKKFRSSVELLIVMYYYQIRAYLMLGNVKKVNQVYSEAQAVEKMKKRPNLIHYDELDGLHELALGNNKKAYECFKSVKVSKMNPKEIIFIYSQLANLSSGEEKAEYQQRIQALREGRVS